MAHKGNTTVLLFGVFFIMSCSPSSAGRDLPPEPEPQKAVAPAGDMPSAMPAEGKPLAAEPAAPAAASPPVAEAPAAAAPPPDAAEPLAAARQPINPSLMALIPGGAFYMGSTDGDDNEKPVHEVTVRGFAAGKYEVSQKEYVAVMGNNPSGFKGDNLPVENVTWFDAVEYCKRLSEKEGLPPAYREENGVIVCDFDAPSYRLPTEAEWEYAARSANADFVYAGSNEADSAGWYNANSDGKTREAGQKKANGFGLHDMSGNVAEWCWDWFGGYDEETRPNKSRVVRGGSWGSSARNLRLTSRNFHGPLTRNSSVGFRVVRSGL
jgi:formylglycine-generating enzyme required for sulfatase activity